MTREELWLAAIAGLDGVNPPDYPVWHYEDMLAAIYDAVVGADSPRQFPERSWHLDEVLYAVYCVAAGLADPGCPEPTCRLEQFWKGIHDVLVGDADASVPSPVWRIEEFLSAVFAASAGWGERTLTGSIVSFIGRSYTRILECTTSITPIQDLHGYDAPWPGGGGKNKFDPVVGELTANKTLNASGEVGDSQDRSCTVGYTQISASTTYTLSFDSTMRNGVFFYDSSKEFISLLSWGDTPRTFETPSNAAYVRFSFFEATPPTNFQLELGSSATTYSPYSNICPITGWTGANIHRTGKNFMPTITEPITVNGITATPQSDGGIALSGTASATSYIDLDTNFDSTRFAGYLFSGLPDTGTWNASNVCYRIAAADSRTSIQDFFRSNGTYNSQAVVDNGSGLRFAIRIPANYQLPEDFVIYPMLRAANTSDTFEPYNGTTYNVNWQSAAGTVYRGTLDVTSGKLTVTHWGFDMGDIDYTESSTYAKRFAGFFPSNKDFPDWTTTDVPSGKLICSIYKERSYDDVWVGGQNAICVYRSGGGIMKFGICEPSCADAAAFKQFVTGQTVVYELSIPIEYTLTPQTVTALLGQNYIWADTGDVAVTVKGASV